MDEEEQPINPNASQGPANPDRMAQEARIRMALQRRLSLGDEATLLSEKTAHPRRRHRIRNLLVFILIIFGGGALIMLGLNKIVIPKLLDKLPGLLHSPYQELPSYKRTVKGIVDYYPPIDANQKHVGISEFDHGASFTLVSSATVIPHSGLEGVFRLDFEKTKTATAESDIDVGYKVLFPKTKDSKDVGIYFFFNHWPAFLQAIGLNGESRGQWFGYDSSDPAVSKEGFNELISFLNPETNRAETQSFIDALWQYASRHDAVQWKVEHLVRSLTDGTQVTDIRVAIKPEQFVSMLGSFVTDPIYTGDVKKIGEAKIAGTNVMGLLGSLRSLNGLITIGIRDRFMHEASWNFDLNDKSAGTYRGTISSTLDLIESKKEIAKPEESKSAVDILNLFAVDDGTTVSTTTPAAIDSDGDGLSDADEAKYHTDPLVTDTDKDGFTDGDEVRRGFNPLGPGKLKK